MPQDAPLSSAQLSEQLEHLGTQLVWRIGKAEGKEGVTVRLGYASSTPRFAQLTKLRSVNDLELQEALAQNTVYIEWVD